MAEKKKTTTRTVEEFPVKVDRNVYPRLEYRFPNAKIGLTCRDSAADFPRPLGGPEGARNILLGDPR